jgi:bifunctional N-acetylglucosamine-1-phosphate-uridyltransferase/glucosamine-1-phosphate-acetyltransferase GlmU-like protein
MEKLAVIVLAAGLGKRMRSSLPKVLTKTIDKPLICHTLSTLSALAPELVAIVTGHGAELVEDIVSKEVQGGELSYSKVAFPRQEAQLGTAHADTAQDIQDHRQELDVVDWATEAVVAKVSRAVIVRLAARTALLAIF